MTNRLLLNNVDHHDLRVIAGHSPAFGDSVNQVLVFPTEFDAVQREYPILFRRDSEATQAVALLGLDADENLFLDDSGWQARYVPAIQRRGPFSIGVQERDDDGELRREPLIHIDLDDPRVGQTEGLPLFLPHGGNAPYLEHISEVLRTIYVGIETAGTTYAAFEALGLLQPIKLEIMLSEVERYVISDYLAMDPERLAALDGAELERLNRGGHLRAAFLAASSLANVNRLIELKNRKRGVA
jgi:hypothetical protein